MFPSAEGAFVITPSDANNLAKNAERIYVGGTGALSVIMADGSAVVFAAVPVGVFYINVIKVLATGTTATNLVGLTY